MNIINGLPVRYSGKTEIVGDQTGSGRDLDWGGWQSHSGTPKLAGTPRKDPASSAFKISGGERDVPRKHV